MDGTLEQRKESAKKLIERHPTKVPIFVTIDFTKETRKYLLPQGTTVGEFYYFIRSSIKLHQEDSLFIFFGDCKLLSGSTLLSQAYDKYKDEDNYLKVIVMRENTFG